MDEKEMEMDTAKPPTPPERSRRGNTEA
jgi:hypothetical protein